MTRKPARRPRRPAVPPTTAASPPAPSSRRRPPSTAAAKPAAKSADGATATTKSPRGKRPAAPARQAAPAPTVPKTVPQTGLKAALVAASGVKAARPRHDPDRAMKLPEGRKDLRGVVVYLNELAKDQLAQLAHQQRCTVQELGVEAINLLFRHYREKPIA